MENLLGPDACLRDGPLKDALEEAASRRLAHGLHRAGLRGPADHWILPAPPGAATTAPTRATPPSADRPGASGPLLPR
ncbi:hypothetical protein [Streptomyces sp. MNU103]|uniref:hypothetical protein n=1 Tax=Streptomyces sp. MNU103 TaxID=2560024 RepID=UPI003FD07151